MWLHLVSSSAASCATYHGLRLHLAQHAQRVRGGGHQQATVGAIKPRVSPHCIADILCGEIADGALRTLSQPPKQLLPWADRQVGVCPHLQMHYLHSPSRNLVTPLVYSHDVLPACLVTDIAPQGAMRCKPSISMSITFTIPLHA